MKVNINNATVSHGSDIVLSAYSGTVLFVSHDRALLRSMADALIVFDKEEGAYWFPCSCEEYCEMA